MTDQIRPIHGYGEKLDGSGWVLLVGLTAADLENFKLAPFHLTVDQRFRRITEVIFVYGETRDDVRLALIDATATLNIPTSIERPKD